jgi:hypothetical protein
VICIAYPTEQIAATKPPLHVWQSALVRPITLHAIGWNGARFAHSHFRHPARLWMIKHESRQ